MKSTIRSMGYAVIAVAAFGVAASASAAKPVKSNLLAPTCLVAAADAEAATSFLATWTSVDGANKYSVEYVASYDTDGDTFADLTQDFDFGSVESPLSTLLADLNITIACEADPENGCTYSPTDVSVHVKALNPPTRKWGAQDNPFTDFVTVLSGGIGTGGATSGCAI